MATQRTLRSRRQIIDARNVERGRRLFADEKPWCRQAACRGLPAVVFYPPDGERGIPRLRREQRAKRLCSACPVIRECLRHALSWPEEHGIWAGTTPAERRLWRTKRC